jgi:ATP-dependent exoDNAse (exonuclease V) beta subunit
LAYIRLLHERRRWMSPSELLTRIAVDRRAFELGFAQGRARDVWRRLRFVIDQARAWSDATAGNLRQYLQWVEQQTAEGARVAEAILPETDDEAVRIMTIHGAKGLEFPIVILSGMSTEPRAAGAAAQVVFPPSGGVGYRIGKGVTTQEYADWRPIDEQMGYEERIRLLYVACTRAKDHLVVSLRRKPRPSTSVAKPTNAELLSPLCDGLPDVGGVLAAPLPLAPPLSVPPLGLSFAAWAAERASLVRRPATIAATALSSDGTPVGEDSPDPGLLKRPRDLDLPPWQKGRYGTAVGRAVHGVLQTVPLAGAGDEVGLGVIDAAVAAQCEAEAIPSRAAEVRSLVGFALRAPCVLDAARSPHWREVYACTPLGGGRLLEGYVDLLYRGPDGLVVVDYKTAATSDSLDLDGRMEGYRLQGAAYALAVGAATGESVTRVVFLFLTPAGAIERDLATLPAAMDEVRARAVG